MATLPRMYSSKHGSTLTSPFSTSPRKLQEMLPSPDGHDVTVASGVSMKQFEDQLNGLRKENFHLKLRVYFLEEKLGSGAPPAVQGLLEHNVRLQVEVEELRRQLTDKQELLAAAAEAIDVLEHQGSISTDSVEASMDNNYVTKKIDTNEKASEQTCEDTCLETESAGDFLGTTVTIDKDSLNELLRLRRENRKALQMIKECMKKIQQQDKEIKKLKLNKELAYAHVSDSQLEKYEEIVKCKNEYIKDLETKIKELQTNIDNTQGDSSGNLQELLTRRLQGLAFFLDKLLSHKCVLGEDKKKLAESILEQSLALPVGLKLDESMAPEDFTMDESNLDMSQSLRIEDLTLMFGHHVQCGGLGLGRGRGGAATARHDLSESECWSEPDRNVSLARIGLGAPASPEPVAGAGRLRARRSRLSHGSRSDENKHNGDATLYEEQLERLQAERSELAERLERAEHRVGDLNEALAAERAAVIHSDRDAAAARERLAAADASVKELERRLSDATQLADRLRAEKADMEAAFSETEQALRRAADEAAVHASEAALERARAQHERLCVERELEETRERLAATTASLHQHQHRTAPPAPPAHPPPAPPTDDDRPTSPDQGIDSDRLSSLEQNDALTVSPRSLYDENISLKQKLERTKATLADTLILLNAANMKKRHVQRAICREIHKTNGVLRKARDQFGNTN